MDSGGVSPNSYGTDQGTVGLGDNVLWKVQHEKHQGKLSKGNAHTRPFVSGFLTVQFAQTNQLPENLCSMQDKSIGLSEIIGEQQGQMHWSYGDGVGLATLYVGASVLSVPTVRVSLGVGALLGAEGRADGIDVGSLCRTLQNTIWVVMSMFFRDTIRDVSYAHSNFRQSNGS